MRLTMEIFTLLDELEDILDRSRNLPFSAKTVVNKEEILDLLKEIRLKLPDELKQAKWVKEERQRILVEAQKEADDIFFVFFCRRLYGNVFYSADRI